ncbi:MAG: acetyl esterase [Micromonosporaceae bacterium]|nr:acetyl esterase [Micromonosporaceae bacterium]
MNLDPEIAALLDVLDAGFPPVHTMTGAQARAVIRSRYVPPAEPEPVAEVRDEVVRGPGGDIPVRIYRPTGENLPVLVYAHGGGFVFCDLDSHDGLCRSFANHVPAVVISVAYRLAPEHPWPAAADDVYAVAQAAAAGAFGGDPGRIVVGGDSAGGNLAAVAALMARDRGGPALAAQLLIYPVLAADFDTESYRLFGRGYYNPKPAMQWYWDQYAPSVTDRTHPYAAPAHADLSGLPPTVLVIAGHDPLRDEALAYASALEAADVPVTRAQFDGVVHGFMSMPILDIAQQARRQACEKLNAAIGSTRD